MTTDRYPVCILYNSLTSGEIMLNYRNVDWCSTSCGPLNGYTFICQTSPKSNMKYIGLWVFRVKPNMAYGRTTRRYPLEFACCASTVWYVTRIMSHLSLAFYHSNSCTMYHLRNSGFSPCFWPMSSNKKIDLKDSWIKHSRIESCYWKVA